MTYTTDLTSLFMENVVIEKATKLGRLLGEADALKKEPYGTGIIVERIKNAANTSKLSPDLQAKTRDAIDAAYEVGWKSVTGSSVDVVVEKHVTKPRKAEKKKDGKEADKK
jgi:hypothetical protein